MSDARPYNSCCSSHVADWQAKYGTLARQNYELVQACLREGIRSGDLGRQLEICQQDKRTAQSDLGIAQVKLGKLKRQFELWEKYGFWETLRERDSLRERLNKVVAAGENASTVWACMDNTRMFAAVEQLRSALATAKGE